jgi:hypothetical protein
MFYVKSPFRAEAHDDGIHYQIIIHDDGIHEIDR